MYSRRHVRNFFFCLLLSGCIAPVEASNEWEDEMTKPTKNNPAEVMPVNAEDNTLLAVAPIIARNGWWSGNNELGYELEFSPNVQNRQTILKLSEWGPPVVWTLALGIEHETIVGLAERLDIKAVIEFGSGGATQQVTIDWTEGNAISLPANAINVIAEYVNPDTPPAGTKLRATVARGSLLNPRPVLSQNFTGFPAPGFADPLPEIPKFAKSVLIIGNDAAANAKVNAATFSLQLFGTSDKLIPTGHIIGTQWATYPLGFPIVGAARYWNVIDGGVIPPTDTFQAIFFIGL